MPSMRAAQISAPGSGFEIVTKTVPEPGENSVRIKVQACGICHGDSVVKEGHYPGLTYPRVPGHEVVGTIDKLGPGVSGWRLGQRVGVGWYGGPCLQCDACKAGDYWNCRRPLTTGISFDGGYAEYMVVAKQAVAAIPDELKSLEAAPLLCAGRTTFTALRNSGAKGGELVAIQGIGGLGHMGVQFSRKLGFRTVAISRGNDKKDLSRKLGADIYIDAKSSNAAAELQKLGGARVILATAPDSKAIAELVSGLGFEGQMIIVAAPPDPIPVFAGQLFGGRRSIRGWVASRANNPAEDALTFAVLSGALPMIEVFPLEKVTEAYEKMISARVHFRSVLKIGD